ncbi:hypothetical protein CC1G_01125 [Coprinopsis cinerea okayama7|uniref:Uncharacterized protein n=1 Tax=Coprinopsis cinerea (strain Okayama-7 / 130 / ATCC MYA-4618 / FGSC 9003) TaxID=240176 RepID=A8NEL3_COPC7|nr:hypothetical protein CC1G_01125 [Coprinopsis cinerea okayama7\|eukprot:XP_001833063.2 hypothetical protein CC1G_01125 [Coprinopsis cinerea okayama7\
MVWTLLGLYLLSCLPSIAYAQTSKAVCLPYYTWINNSQGKTPCEVAASLQSVCSEDGIFEVLPLAEDQHYPGPTLVANANTWEDSEKVSLTATYVYFNSDKLGILGGANGPPIVLKFPESLPEGVLVPAWAYQDVTESDTFDQFLARENANATESSAVSAPAPAETLVNGKLGPETSIKTEPEAVEPTTTPEGEAKPASDASEKEKAGQMSYANKVGGAVTGALLGILLVALVAFLVIRRRRARRLRVGEFFNDTRSRSETQPHDEKGPIGKVGGGGHPTIQVSGADYS